MNLKEILKEKRPNLSKSSINAYNSTLNTLHHRVFPNEELDIRSFDDTQKIIKSLENIPPNKRKSILASLVVISDKKEYRDLMIEDIKEYNKETARQKKTKAQELSWIEMPEIEEKYKQLEAKWNILSKRYLKQSLDLHKPKEIQEMQDFVILSVLGGIYIPPRRLKDYVDFKIAFEDPEKDNYKKANKLIFNSYKTAKTYGKQEVKIPPKLSVILNKWFIINPTNHLFIDNSLKPLTNVKLNQRINKIFNNKKVSCNQLRHTYLTHKYGGNIETDKALAEDFTQMGSSIAQEKVYIKE
jgi:integrase